MAGPIDEGRNKRGRRGGESWREKRRYRLSIKCPRFAKDFGPLFKRSWTLSRTSRKLKKMAYDIYKKNRMRNIFGLHIVKFVKQIIFSIIDCVYRS